MQARKRVVNHKFAYAANELLELMEEHGGIAGFMEKLMAHPEQYAEDVVMAVHVAIAEYECDHL